MNENKRGIQKRVITNIETRDKFLGILKEMNPGLFVIKLGAKWCGPCKQIAPIIDGFFASSPSNVLCADIDVDECFNLYSFLKTKKMVNGVPTILCYVKGNHGYVPNCSVSGGDPNQLHFFFKKCGNILEKLNKLNNNEDQLTSL